ncbi:MAG: amino acid permease [Acidobacteria bacterium]|nr:amino acid permease [Acidobacteriota bacterium]
MSHLPSQLPSSASAGQRELPRVLGFTSVVGILVGTVIGSGIFVAPNRIASLVESPQIIMAVWAVGGILSFFGALAFAELGAAYPQAGGMYVYLREGYGRLIAFLFGWTLFLVIDSGAIATLSVAFSTRYLPYFVPLSPLAGKLVALALITMLVIVNILGVRYGAALQNVLMFIKFGAIVAVSLVVFTFVQGNTAHFVQPPPGPVTGTLVGNFGAALVLALWAYKGWEAVSFSTGEIKNPERNVPIGLVVGTAVAILLYISTNLAYLYVFPAAEIAKSSRIAADVMNVALGPIGASIIAAVILFSITGAANGNVLTAPRVFFAMARDGLFFKRFADLHPRLLTPHVSILATGGWAAVLSVTGTFEQLATYVIFGQWIFFGLTVGAVMVLRRTKPDLPRPYRTWGYPVTPIIFILAALYISLSTLITQPLNALGGLAIIAAGVPAFFYWQRQRR